MSTFLEFDTADVRFRTSEQLDGSDAMNLDPDYSASYVILRTDLPGDHEGHGFVFTIGRGNEVQIAAIKAAAHHIEGTNVEEALADMGATSRRLLHDSQLRWLGPEKGVIHMAIGAIINALWDLRAKRAGVPLWEHLARLSPEEIVSLVDFRYLSDALTPEDALEILRQAEDGKEDRITYLKKHGYPAYTTSPGWLGYSDEKLARLCREAKDDGFTQIKLKVGGSLEDDVRRMTIARQTLGEGFPIAIDANQRWDVGTAIEWVKVLESLDIHWVEEPTSPDDVLGHAAIARAIAPIPVATGEHAQNRVIFKQLLQAQAIGMMQIDAARVGGVNENIANLLLAAKFGIPVCPHAGGVGLCEAVQHLSFFDYASVSASLDGRVIEYVDHLHEHFVDPVVIDKGNYRAPSQPGASTQMRVESIKQHTFVS